MIRPILRLGPTVLQQPSAPVPVITSEIEVLIDDMVETMYAAPGIGLAAPQVGLALRVFVIDLSVGRDPKALVTMINPEWVERDGMQLEEEGCLSVPGFSATVPRPRRVVVSGLDRHGVHRKVEGTGLLARALQHEMDHLDGRLYLDRLGHWRRRVVLHRIRALRQNGRW